MRRSICWIVLSAALLTFAPAAFLETAATAADAPPTLSGIAPQSGPWSGGTTVTLTGTNLESAYSVMFGGMSAGILSESDTEITAFSPMGSGSVTVTVTTPYGSVDTEEFYYIPAAPPTLSGISPSSGTPAGGTTVTLTGTNLQTTSSVYFGSTSATIRSGSDTEVTVTAPPGSGTVEVVAYNPGGESNAVSFTYAVPQHGYWLVGSDGGIFTFGSGPLSRLDRQPCPPAAGGGHHADGERGRLLAGGFRRRRLRLQCTLRGVHPGLGPAPGRLRARK